MANRVESKRYQQQLNDLLSEQNKGQKELLKVEEQIEKRLAKIERLNEQANKTSIKTQVLGKDSERSEYWFFKEEPSKLFIKKLEDSDGMVDTGEVKQQSIVWYYYDEEIQFDQLVEACNIKGVRERRL